MANESDLAIKVGAPGWVTRPLPVAEENAAPVGAWVKLPYPDLRGQPIAQVREVVIADLYLPELDERGRLQPEKRGYVEGYAARLRAGERAPNIQIVEMEDGRQRVVDGHRRVVAALKEGRQTIRATVSPLIQTAEGKVPLTLELASMSRAEVSLRDIEEPVQMIADHGALKEPTTHLRFFLNEYVIARILEVNKAVNANSAMDEGQSIRIPFTELGCRLVRGCREEHADHIDWTADILPDRADLAVFYDGIEVFASSPATGGALQGAFVFIEDLRAQMREYDLALREVRASNLGASLEAAMADSGEGLPAPSRGPGLI